MLAHYCSFSVQSLSLKDHKPLQDRDSTEYFSPTGLTAVTQNCWVVSTSLLINWWTTWRSDWLSFRTCHQKRSSHVWCGRWEGCIWGLEEEGSTHIPTVVWQGHLWEPPETDALPRFSVEVLPTQRDRGHCQVCFCTVNSRSPARPFLCAQKRIPKPTWQLSPGSTLWNFNVCTWVTPIRGSARYPLQLYEKWDHF